MTNYIEKRIIQGGIATVTGIGSVLMPAPVDDLRDALTNPQLTRVPRATKVSRQPHPSGIKIVPQLAEAGDLNFKIVLPYNERSSTNPIPPTLTPTPIGGASGPEPTRTPTPNPDLPIPTATPRPSAEGEPTLSVAEHFSRLNTVETITVDGVTVNILKTNDAFILAHFATPELRQEFARRVAENRARILSSADTSANSYDSVNVVFVKNYGDSPVGVNMQSSEVRGQDGSPEFYGLTGYTRLDTKLVYYVALEPTFDVNDPIASGYRNWYLGLDPLKFSRDGTSPYNNITSTTEERRLLDQYPIRVN